MLREKFHIIIPPGDITCEPGLQERVTNGDRDAFIWVYKNYSRKLYDYTLLLVGCPVQAEDIVQDVFLKLWLKKESIAAVENFNAWIFSITKNTIFDYHRRQQLHTTEMIFDDMPVEDKSMLPSQWVEYKEQVCLLQQTVNRC